MLETVCPSKVFYLFDDQSTLVKANNKKIHNSRVFNVINSEINALKNYFIQDKAIIKLLYNLIIEIQPDIVHHNNGVTVNRVAIRAASKAHVLQVLHCRSIWSYRKSLVNYFFDFFLIRKISKRIYITEAVRNYSELLFHLNPSSAIVLHDFVDQEVYYKQPPDLKLQNEFAIHENDFVITNLGRITEWKGQHILIEAINLIKDKIINFKVLIVGSWENGIGSADYFHRLKKLVDSYQLQDYIFFTGNRSDVPGIINCSDVIVHTALKPEPQGLVIIEALLCEKPVIASNAGGAAEIVKKYGGFLIEPGDKRALAALLLQMIEDKNKKILYEIDYCKYEKLRNDFNCNHQREVIMKIYDELKKKTNG